MFFSKFFCYISCCVSFVPWVCLPFLVCFIYQSDAILFAVLFVPFYIDAVWPIELMLHFFFSCLTWFLFYLSDFLCVCTPPTLDKYFSAWCYVRLFWYVVFPCLNSSEWRMRCLLTSEYVFISLLPLLFYFCFQVLLFIVFVFCFFTLFHLPYLPVYFFLFIFRF